MRRRADRGRRRARRRRASPTPTRASPAGARAPARRGHRRHGRRRRRRRPPRSLAPYLHHRRTGRPFCRRQGRDQPRRPHRRRRRLVALDHRARGPRRRPRAARRLAGGRGRRRHRARRPARAHRARRRRRRRARQPLRVLLDARGRVPATGPLFDLSLAPTLVVTTDGADAATERRGARAGAEVRRGAARPTARGVDLDDVARAARPRGVLQALVEGGATLPARSSRAVCVDRVVALRRRAHASASDGRPLFAGRARRRSPTRAAGARRASRQLGADVRLDYEPLPACGRGGAGLMFTGIVEELGRCAASRRNAGGARFEYRRRARCSTTPSSAIRSRSTAAASPSSSSATSWWAADAVVETLRRTNLGELRAGRPR